MNKKRIVILSILILAITITTTLIITYFNNMPNQLFDKGISYMDSKEYNKAREIFSKLVEKDTDIEDAHKLINIIDNYLLSQKLFADNKVMEANEEINKIDPSYINYSISNDIDILKNKIIEAVKIIEIDNKINEIILIVNEKRYNDAKEMLAEIKNKKLNDIQNQKISDIEIKIEEEIRKIEAEEAAKKAEEEAKKAEEEKLNTSKFKIENTSVASYSDQIIGVVSDGGSFATLVRYEKNSDGKWIEIDSMPARIGVNGMASPNVIYEMDKRTPTGVYSLTEAFGINSNPGSGLPYRVVSDNDYWVDDSNSAYYNQWMEGPVNDRWSTAEHLASYPGYYNYSVVIDYNRWPVIPGKSSAIFIHCEMGVPTYGCVAVAERKLIEILKWLNPSKNPHIIIAESWNELYSY